LAVIPSLGDNSPNTVYECLEQRIPFIASDVGGIPELIAPEDRGRVLFEPTTEGVAEALRRALSDDHRLQPARAAFDGSQSLAEWAKVIEMQPAARPRESASKTRVDVVLVRRTSRGAPARCREALDRQSFSEFSVIEVAGTSVEQARVEGLRAGTAPYVVFLDEEDIPDSELLTMLVRAQAASGADVVTCAVRLGEENGSETLHFFAGQPGGLGALSNDYGTVALLRRAVLDRVKTARAAQTDPDWPLLAGLAAAGAHIVSVPIPLVTRRSRPGSVEQSPGDALLVLERLEQSAPDQLRLIGRLATGLATLPISRPAPTSRQRVVQMARGVLRRLRRGPRAH
jgi:hypothetical protein